SDRCHALIGPETLLPPHVALLSYAWQGWDTVSWDTRHYSHMAPLVQLHTAALSSSGADHDLDVSARTRQQLLVELVAAVLRNPRVDLSVRDLGGVPADLRGRAALLWGLAGTVRDLLRVPGERELTFSTFEERHSTSVRPLPWVIFVPPDVQQNRNMPARG